MNKSNKSIASKKRYLKRLIQEGREDDAIESFVEFGLDWAIKFGVVAFCVGLILGYFVALMVLGS